LDAQPASQRLIELTRLFLKLGFTAFGGPAAHIALFHDEVVVRRRWMNDQEFLDLLGATNLIPGPNSTEMVIHIGLRRAGWPGLILAGLCFTTPAMLIVLLLAWFYVRFGSMPQVEGLLYGVKPVIILIILQALWGLGQKALKSPTTILASVLALGLSFFNINPILALFGGGLVVMLAENLPRLRSSAAIHILLSFWGLYLPRLIVAPFSMTGLFLTFLKIGAVLYGSGYVLLAFLHADFVTRLGWLSEQQLIDAIAVGQITPGPLFTTATFIGYLLNGVPGAILSTLGIFLPSFVFVALSSPFLPRLRHSTWLGSFLDGVNAASLGLMGVVTWQIIHSTFTDSWSFLLALVAGLFLIRYRVNTTWLILGGALGGFLIRLLT